MPGILIGIPLLARNFLQSIGLKYTTVSNSAFITGLDVLLIPILKFAVYKKRVANKIWLACTIVLIGLYIIVVKDGFSLNYGDLWIVACAFAFAFYVLQVGKYSTETDPIPSVIVLMLFCTVGSGLFSVFDSEAVWIPFNMDFWKGILFAGLFATAFMYTVQNIGMSLLTTGPSF
ncbi:DMT family transporter [Chryseobacterium sp. Ch-15]|uniref:DMT family transporter n=1 Tax=Chryseobacterium muglaense TaxID=2893752 RepID=A0A9Q3YPJ4_9FLAO|nr:DMT family transporter [Chryseobacterium muglaense]MBD3906086.1 DMT family transporter [Chryseobacterium muglaense]MCC9032976.1 DMT family transporter [Chryseobacterium muglaense]MCM2556556.1 DMT family transporter [Chryseobacterium muglaense]